MKHTTDKDSLQVSTEITLIPIELINGNSIKKIISRFYLLFEFMTYIVFEAFFLL